jgi:hypothetical protein
LVLANLPPGIVLQDAGIVAILLFFLLFNARVAWEALRQCRGCREWSRVLLLIVSVTIPALAALHDAFLEPKDRDAMTIAPIRLALGAIATLWAVATIGAPSPPSGNAAAGAETGPDGVPAPRSRQLQRDDRPRQPVGGQQGRWHRLAAPVPPSWAVCL